jgi:Cyclic nucleotide-binding domain/PilZ domain
MMKPRAESRIAAFADPRGRRKHLRKRAFLPAQLEVAGESLECQVLDFSLGGAMVELAHPLAERQTVVLSIEPIGSFPGTVVWQVEGRAGIGFGLASRTAKATGLAAIQAQIFSVLGATPQLDESVPAMPSGDVPHDPTVADAGATPDERGAEERRVPREILKLARGQQGIVVLHPGETLSRAGDPAGRLYVVRRGRLRVEGSNGTSEYVETGGLLGEMGTLRLDLQCRATALAVTECELVEIDSRRFVPLIEEALGFSVTVMQALIRHPDRPGESEHAAPRAG